MRTELDFSREQNKLWLIAGFVFSPVKWTKFQSESDFNTLYRYPPQLLVRITST